ncbi:PREDICTED: putative lipid-binding protein AIR1B [Camelina sativa]|uniref:Lipid-binding protein AIR1B n=1 Tax=Camelina sativa TaxID=90675 RepID=A0ABM0V0A1_CAMSA|nr:PREDICTED: putative lipid-binding protein AIR1B [Camelina sativa]
MASKNMMKNTIALVLTINLVFFGFTVAQAPPPQAPTCPRDIQACVNVLSLSVFINPRSVSQCCTLVAGLDASVASVCLCNAVRVNVLNLVDLNVRLGQLLNTCGVNPPTGFRCA